MKKLIIPIAVAVCGVGGFFGYNHSIDKGITDSSKWTEVGNGEFIARIPDNMESESRLLSTSAGQEQIAYYSNSKTAFSVAKIPFSANKALESIDLESYCNNLEINGKKLNITPINDGFYYSCVKNSSGVFKNTDSIFVIEGIFRGDSAVYSVAVQCRAEDKNSYEDSMTEWLESFRLE